MAEQPKKAPAKKAAPKAASAASTPEEPIATLPRWRRIVAGFLVVIGCLLVPLSLSAVWVRNTLLDTDHYVATVGPLAESRNIQQGLADRLTTALFADGQVEQKIADALPPQAEVLAAPLSGGLETVANKAALGLIQSSRFQSLWDNVNRKAHAAVVEVLTGGGSRVSTKDGTVSINVEQIFTNVKQRLDDRGISLFDSVQLPAKYQSVVLFQSKTLEQVQEGVDLLQTLAWVLPFVLIACFAGAIALSGNRRRTIFRAGIGVALVVALQLAALKAGRSLYLDAITNAGLRRGSAGDVWDQVTSFLRTAGITTIVVALLVAIAAWIAGPSRVAGHIRNLWNRALAGAGAKADDADVATGSIAAFIARSKSALRIVGVAVALLILILWNHPTAGTVIGVAVLLLVYLALIEFLGARVRRRQRIHQGLIQVSPRLPRPSLDGVLNLVDVDAVLEHVDVNQLLDRIDVQRVLDRVDINELLDRVDVEALMAKVDVNALVGQVNVEELVQRTELGAIIADSTSGIAQRLLDSVRAQAVSLDHVSNVIVGRLLRRSADTPAGPPHFVA